MNHQLRLFVDGALATRIGSTGVAIYNLAASDTAATGPFMVVSDETGDLFAGWVLDPFVVQGIASSTQMANHWSSGSLKGGF